MSSNLIDRTTDWGIAKLVKASDSESDMRRFESYYPCHTFESPVFSEHRAFRLSIFPPAFGGAGPPKVDGDHFIADGRTSERTSSDFFIMPLSIRNFMSFSRPFTSPSSRTS